MRFDTIIIGGGLAGLVCGIRLQKAGQKCAIISSGQNALHFFSGSFDILNRLPDGTEVENPVRAMKKLPAGHPYSVIGADVSGKLAGGIKDFFHECGIELTGSHEKNSYRVTPTGDIRPTGLSLADFTTLTAPGEVYGKHIIIVNILGYLDFNTRFLADSFEKSGAECRIVSLRLEEMERLRRNPSEMRAVNIARVMDREGVWKKVVDMIAGKIEADTDCVVLPAVFGLTGAKIVEEMRKAVSECGKSGKLNTVFIPTMPPSVPGVRTQLQLKAVFERSGGRFILGDTVKSAATVKGNVCDVATENFGDIRMSAGNFVLATGSFFSKGLVAVPDRIYEPLFGLDVLYDEDRSEWNDLKFFSRQNYIGYGVKTDRNLHPFKDGAALCNLYAIGSVLGGANTLYEGSGAGVAILSAMYAAEHISGK